MFLDIVDRNTQTGFVYFAPDFYIEPQKGYISRSNSYSKEFKVYVHSWQDSFEDICLVVDSGQLALNPSRKWKIKKMLSGNFVL